jgi:hypothetical protein
VIERMKAFGYLRQSGLHSGSCPSGSPQAALVPHDSAHMLGMRARQTAASRCYTGFAEDALFLVVKAPEGIGDKASGQNRGSEEPAPFGDAHETDHD